MKSTKIIQKTLLMILLEGLLIVVLGIAGLFIISYIRVNFSVFEALSILEYAAGWDKFWMWMYLFGDCLYFIVLSLMFLELVLLLLRVIAKILFKYLEFVTNRSMDKWLSAVKQISLITLFRLMKINTTKRGLIAYFIVILYTFGTPFIAEKVLESRDSLIYRAHELVNLFEESQTIDATNAIDTEQVIDVTIQAGVGNIHVYAVDDTTEIKIYYFFDNQSQLDSYDSTIDLVNHSIDIAFNLDQRTYVEYQEAVMPSVEIYLPENLLIGSIDAEISVEGNFIMNYVLFESLDLTIVSGNADITSEFVAEQAVKITAYDSDVAVKLKAAQTFEMISVRSTANLRLFDVYDTVTLSIRDHSDLFLYSCLTDHLDFEIDSSNVELRELYASESIQITVTSSTFVYMNSRENDPLGTVTIDLVESESRIDGVVLD